VTGPPTANIAPPGYYMLFLVNNAGVPSIANFVQVISSPNDQPPKGTITSPASNLTVSTNQPVTFAGTATNGGSTVATTQWIFPGGSPLTSPSLNAGSVLFSEPGTYVASLTAVDNLGVNDPSPPTLTITVQSSGGGTLPVYVQGNFAVPQTPQATVTVPYSVAQTAGDLNLVVVGWNDTNANVSSVNDSEGNVYQLAVGPTLLSGANGGPLSQSIYYAPNIPAASAGANTVTVTFTQAANYADIRVLEYSGLAQTNPVDTVASASGNSTTSSSGNLTTTSATDLLIGANVVETGTTGPGTGFTQRLLTSDGDIAEDEVVTSVGTYSATAPLYSPPGGWIMQLVAFHP
jgi:hypothetical protein